MLRRSRCGVRIQPAEVAFEFCGIVQERCGVEPRTAVPWVVQLAGCPAENAISGEQIRQVLRMKTLIVVERPVPGLSGGINSQSHVKIIARVSLSYGAFAPCALRPSDNAQPVALPAVNGKIPASLVSAFGLHAAGRRCGDVLRASVAVGAGATSGSGTIRTINKLIRLGLVDKPDVPYEVVGAVGSVARAIDFNASLP